MALWRKKQPEAGEVLLATVVLPDVGQTIDMTVGDEALTAQVAEVRDRDLGFLIGDEAREFDFSTQVRIRWVERGGRRTLETNARIVQPENEDERLHWVVDIGEAKRRDRRAYVRAPIRTHVTVVKDASQAPWTGTSVDMSELSVAFELDPATEHDIAVDDDLRIAFSIEHQLFRFGGHVIRVDPHRIVARFPDLPSKERDDLRSKILAETARR